MLGFVMLAIITGIVSYFLYKDFKQLDNLHKI